MKPVSQNEAAEYGLKFQNGLMTYGHCQTRILETPIVDEAAISSLQLILANFHSASLSSAVRVGGSSTSSNNYHCQLSDSSTLILRENLGQQSQPYLEANAEALQEAFELQAPIAKPLRAISGTWSIKSGPVFWTAFNFIQANSYFKGGVGQMSQAGAAIGKLHSVLSLPEFSKRVKAFEVDTAAKYPPLDHKGFAEILQAAEEIEPYSFTTSLLKAETDIISYAIDQQTADASGCIDGTIHYDLHPHNILITEFGASIVDYDNFRSGPLAQDVGFALHRLGRQHAYHFGETGLVEGCRAFLAEYAISSGYLHSDARIAGHGLNRTLQSLSNVLRSYYLGRDVTLAQILPKFILAQREHLKLCAMTELILPSPALTKRLEHFTPW